MRNIPKIVYNSPAATLTLTHAQRRWAVDSQGVGGTDQSAAGIPESFTIRRDELLRVRLRFTEAEWSAVRGWLVWAQGSGQAFTYFPDKDLAGSYSVYLEAPALGEPFRPEPVDFDGLYEISLVLRTSDAAVFTTAYSE